MKHWFLIICTRTYDLREDQFELDERRQLKEELLGDLLAEFRAFAGV
ncbi:MAG: hypothetical protein FWD61_09715 [Phycisphaerales bacterium]|nr:hypothetical protein [Phycisphaerales bacterium]